MEENNQLFYRQIKGKNILIFGGLGFIGSNLAHRCLKLGANVLIYDSLDPHSGGNLFNVEDIKKDVQLGFHDILDLDPLVHNITGQDIIINCAASTSHPFSMREPRIDLDVNSRGVVNILDAIKRFNKDAKFIHLGTSTQLGRLIYQPADENHPEFPTDIYSANKSVSEKYVLIYSRTYGIRATVLRLTNVFGQRATIRSPEFTFNNYFVGLALQNKKITVYGDGSQKRNVIYVEDVVEAILQASINDLGNSETYFVAGDEHHSVAEIAEATVKYIGSGEVTFVPWPLERKAIEVGDAIISNRKFKETFHFLTKYDLQSGLLKTGEYYKTCMEKYI
jgi:UDP-glucose 4-epimerase